MAKKKGVRISVPNQKGGVAKTTNVVNISSCLSYLGYKVLLVDFDYQGNSSAGLGLKKQALTMGKTITFGLMGDKKAGQVVIKSRFKNLDVIACDMDFSEFPNLKNGIPGGHLLLSDWLEEIRYNYDYIFIDSHPDLSLSFQNAMVASDYYIIPMFSEPDAVDGLHIMFKHLALVKEKLNPTLFLLGCVISKYNKKNATHNKYFKKLQEFGKSHGLPVLAIIPESAAVQGAADSKTPLIYYKPSLKVSEEYLDFAKKLVPLLKPSRRGRTPKTPKISKENVVEFIDSFGFESEQEEAF